MEASVSNEECARQPDHVQVVTVDPRHQAPTEALDRVAAGTSHPFLASDDHVELGAGEVPEGDAGHRMIDDDEARADQADAAEHLMGAPCEVAEHPARLTRVARLAVDPAVVVHGRVDPERDGTLQVDGAGLALGMVADEPDRLGVGWVMLLVGGGEDAEGNAQLLENRTSLRRRRSEDERLGHRGFSATQISSLGHLRPHSTENAS